MKGLPDASVTQLSGGEGGLVWIKSRTEAFNHLLYDTERGAGKALLSDLASSEGAENLEQLSSFNSNGFSVGPNSNVNMIDKDFASWTFRKAPSFFDIATFTSTADANREIPHNLGVAPGMVLLKSTDTSEFWLVYHRDTGNSEYLVLNEDYKSYAGPQYWDATDSAFIINEPNILTPGQEYVVYLFAHDSDEGMIQCGSYTGTGAAGNEIDLGWEPQWLMIKSTGANTGPWVMLDTMRGITTGGKDLYLQANETAEESDAVSPFVDLTARGFKTATGSSFVNTAGIDYIYMAIRRPNKPAEEFEPEELFAIDAGTGAGTTNEPNFPSGFPVDFTLFTAPASTAGRNTFSRLTGTNTLDAHSANAEYANAPDYSMQSNNGFYVGGQTSGFQSWMWRRAPGFFDVVAFNNTGANVNTKFPHGLGVLPELAFVKSRDAVSDWWVMADVDGYAVLNTEDEFVGLGNGNGITSQYLLNATETDMGGFASFGVSGDFIAYLFASVPGVSKLGSYTGNGGSQNIDCGFTNGARFVLIKRTDAAGDWWFTVDPSDPSMLAKLNETDAASDQKTSIAHWANGFFVQQRSITNLSIDGAKYIYYAIA
jgi:hypothetical protein